MEFSIDKNNNLIPTGSIGGGDVSALKEQAKAEMSSRYKELQDKCGDLSKYDGELNYIMGTIEKATTADDIKKVLAQFNELCNQIESEQSGSGGDASGKDLSAQKEQAMAEMSIRYEELQERYGDLSKYDDELNYIVSTIEKATTAADIEKVLAQFNDLCDQIESEQSGGGDKVPAGEPSTEEKA